MAGSASPPPSFMPTGDVPEEKAALRRRMRATLRDFSTTDACLPASATIRDHLLRLIPDELSLTSRGAVATFAALPGEPDLLALLEALPEITWAFPRVVGSDLAFHRIERADDLVAASYGIREPIDDHSTRLAIADIALFLVPGLAFDPPTGGRLGRGRGFYDRALAGAHPGARFIGVGFDCQLIRVPLEAHDRQLHVTVTESGWHRTASRL